MIVTVAFFSQYLPWAVNPKGLEFFYYYFPVDPLPRAGAGAGVLPRRRAARATGRRSASSSSRADFVFFLPVLSAQFPVDPDEFAARIWFDGWR